MPSIPDPAPAGLTEEQTEFFKAELVRLLAHRAEDPPVRAGIGRRCEPWPDFK